MDSTLMTPAEALAALRADLRVRAESFAGDFDVDGNLSDWAGEMESPLDTFLSEVVFHDLAGIALLQELSFVAQDADAESSDGLVVVVGEPDPSGVRPAVIVYVEWGCYQDDADGLVELAEEIYAAAGKVLAAK